MNFLATLDHLKSSSIARKMSVYRSFYTYLAEYMGIIENPLIGIQTPKKSKQIPDFLFVEEIQEYLNSYNDARMMNIEIVYYLRSCMHVDYV